LGGLIAGEVALALMWAVVVVVATMVAVLELELEWSVVVVQEVVVGLKAALAALGLATALETLLP
jgi:hypothetical protein